jgi:hypothetical protein
LACAGTAWTTTAGTKTPEYVAASHLRLLKYRIIKVDIAERSTTLTRAALVPISRPKRGKVRVIHRIPVVAHTLSKLKQGILEFGLITLPEP